MLYDRHLVSVFNLADDYYCTYRYPFPRYPPHMRHTCNFVMPTWQRVLPPPSPWQTFNTDFIERRRPSIIPSPAMPIAHP